MAAIRRRIWHILPDKSVPLRVFEDENGKMNLDIRQTGGQILIVSQFTLACDARHGNRPGFFRQRRAAAGAAVCIWRSAAP
jgi:D-tyrosyl-tRNA(Tyr) deacylase